MMLRGRFIRIQSSQKLSKSEFLYQNLANNARNDHKTLLKKW